MHHYANKHLAVDVAHRLELEPLNTYNPFGNLKRDSTKFICKILQENINNTKILIKLKYVAEVVGLNSDPQQMCVAAFRCKPTCVDKMKDLFK
ncbi:hypothetical protein ACJMK2_008357 [Sinanodonta woodiana]|uniref:Uncharacterized protein n=1 Tax=Sinanodonta woodiana TaxID=1069815 RepID=A0ABD3VNX0_SINWO